MYNTLEGKQVHTFAPPSPASSVLQKLLKLSACLLAHCQDICLLSTTGFKDIARTQHARTRTHKVGLHVRANGVQCL